jgi:hypothetical protein
MEPGEQIICEIKRHPIGMIGEYIGVGLLLLLVGIAAMVAPSVLSSSSHGQVLMVSILVFVAAAAIGTGFLFVVGKIYWGNRWIVTSDSITQVTQTGLFNKQTSQLSFEHLEDITCEQNGIGADMFHYGVLSAETAGAVDKFTFPFCPNPTSYAKQILAARERFDERTRQQPAQSTAPPTPGTDYPGPG